jgi:hypothetical protein
MPELTSDSRPETSSVVDHNPQPASVNGASPPKREQFNILQRGKRLEITAYIDLAGLHALREILTNYEKSLSAPEMEVGPANR